MINLGFLDLPRQTSGDWLCGITWVAVASQNGWSNLSLSFLSFDSYLSSHSPLENPFSSLSVIQIWLPNLVSNLEETLRTFHQHQKLWLKLIFNQTSEEEWSKNWKGTKLNSSMRSPSKRNSELQSSKTRTEELGRNLSIPFLSFVKFRSCSLGIFKSHLVIHSIWLSVTSQQSSCLSFSVQPTSICRRLPWVRFPEEVSYSSPGEFVWRYYDLTQLFVHCLSFWLFPVIAPASFSPAYSTRSLLSLSYLPPWPVVQFSSSTRASLSSDLRLSF